MRTSAIIFISVILAGCYGPDRESSIKAAIEQVKETMEIGVPELPHEGRGDCALVPGLNSTNETLRYQAEVPLPPGDDGVLRQARVIDHWVAKGAKIRHLSYKTGPPNEVEYRGGRIMAFAMTLRGSARAGESAPYGFYIVATTPCVPKVE